MCLICKKTRNTATMDNISEMSQDIEVLLLNHVLQNTGTIIPKLRRIRREE